MSRVKYVTLDPTGNITCLVTGKPDGVDEGKITRRLIRECEQVAYLDEPTLPDAKAYIRLMGGEFCGNAAMASACWLAVRDGVILRDDDEFTVYPIQMSGFDGILNCLVKAQGGSYTGITPMPPVTAIVPLNIGEYKLTCVSMDGIAHAVLEGPQFPNRSDAEALLRRIADMRDEPAVGLLLWDGAEKKMRPLVYVRGSDTMIWETGCGSGSAAIGAYLAHRAGAPITVDVGQPGGVIRVSTRFERGMPYDTTIMGTVRFGNEDMFEYGVQR